MVIVFSFFASVFFSSCGTPPEPPPSEPSIIPSLKGTGVILGWEDVKNWVFWFQSATISWTTVVPLNEEKPAWIFSMQHALRNYINQPVYIETRYKMRWKLHWKFEVIVLKKILLEEQLPYEFSNKEGGYTFIVDPQFFTTTVGGKRTIINDLKENKILSFQSFVNNISQKTSDEPFLSDGTVIDTPDIKDSKVQEVIKKTDNWYQKSFSKTVGEKEFVLVIDSFIPQGKEGEDHSDVQKAAEKLLDSLVFWFPADSWTGKSCGGEEWVICPQGFFCELYDHKDPDSFWHCVGFWFEM